MLRSTSCALETLSRRTLRTAASAGVLLKEFPTGVRLGLAGHQDGQFFHYVWLRDHCRCDGCLHSITRQRLHDTQSINLDIRPINMHASEKGLTLDWTDHRSSYGWDWLRDHAYSQPYEKPPMKPGILLWSREEISEKPPTVRFEEIMQSDRGVLDWLRKVRKYGFCYVTDTPVAPSSTRKLIRRIAFIRETHYGGFWDFTANLAKGDTAYTDIALGAHTDTTYFSDAAGLQLFHLLSPPGSHTGGDSLLVDGFRAARRLEQRRPDLYHVLRTLPIPTHASGGQDTLVQPIVNRPVFEHDDLTDELVSIRWNSDDRAPIGQGLTWQKRLFNIDGLKSPARAVEAFYIAAKEWEDELRNPDAQYWAPYVPGKPFSDVLFSDDFELKAQTCTVFDNRRILHGRSAFSGERRMCGAYINGDDHLSRLRTLERKYRAIEAEQRFFAEKKRAKRLASLGDTAAEGAGYTAAAIRQAV